MVLVHWRLHVYCADNNGLPVGLGHVEERLLTLCGSSTHTVGGPLIHSI
jgi:hypothetical protein